MDGGFGETGVAGRRSLFPGTEKACYCGEVRCSYTAGGCRGVGHEIQRECPQGAGDRIAGGGEGKIIGAWQRFCRIERDADGIAARTGGIGRWSKGEDQRRKG